MARDLGFQGVEIGFHEPRERLEIDEFDRSRRRRVGEKGLHTTPFLAVADKGAFGMQKRLFERAGAIRALLWK